MLRSSELTLLSTHRASWSYPRTGWAGDDDDALGSQQQTVEQLFVVLAEPERIEVHPKRAICRGIRMTMFSPLTVGKQATRKSMR